MGIAFTAARARNAGLPATCRNGARSSYVQFVDGDCELIEGWARTCSLLSGFACRTWRCVGRLRERYPERSIYNWLCDREWEASGRGARLRRDRDDARRALAAVGGFRDDLIAGEEPELCVRLRAAGWRIWRLDDDMALHDAAMTRFGQWWRRAQERIRVRAGRVSAWSPPERHCVWESRRAWLWGVLPLLCLAAVCSSDPGLGRLSDLSVAGSAPALRNHGSLRTRSWLCFRCWHASRKFWAVKFLCDRLLARQARLIEYK